MKALKGGYLDTFLFQQYHKQYGQVHRCKAFGSRAKYYYLYYTLGEKILQTYQLSLSFKDSLFTLDFIHNKGLVRPIDELT